MLGLPCGLLCQTCGINALEAFLLSIFFYSGAGQYMIPNMFLAMADPLSIIASVSLVNTRQMLYSASLSRFCAGVGKVLSFVFAATVTDESFGVNLAQFANGHWDVKRACMVNVFSMLTWATSNAVGVLVGQLISVPTALASFAMTAIFICLLCMQKFTKANICAMAAAAFGVFICKFVGLSGPAILIGAVIGVCIGMLASRGQKTEEANE